MRCLKHSNRHSGPADLSCHRVGLLSIETIDGDVHAEMAESADRCLQAKDRLIEADTDAQLEAAIRRMKILCDDQQRKIPSKEAEYSRSPPHLASHPVSDSPMGDPDSVYARPDRPRAMP